MASRVNNLSQDRVGIHFLRSRKLVLTFHPTDVVVVSISLGFDQEMERYTNKCWVCYVFCKLLDKYSIIGYYDARLLQ